MVGALSKGLRGGILDKNKKKHKNLKYKKDITSLAVDKCGNLYFVKKGQAFFPTNPHVCMTTFSYSED
jgi:hypothetical protein